MKSLIVDKISSVTIGNEIGRKINMLVEPDFLLGFIILIPITTVDHENRLI